MLVVGQLPAFRLQVAHGEVVVTVDALQGAAASDLDGGIGGNPLGHYLAVQLRAEIDVALRLDGLCLHGSNLQGRRARSFPPPRALQQTRPYPFQPPRLRLRIQRKPHQ